MPTPETLASGKVNTLVQNTVYLLPSIRVDELAIYSDVALEVANDVAFTTTGSIPANITVGTSALYVRCTTGTALVTVKSGSAGSAGSISGTVSVSGNVTVTNTVGNPVFSSIVSQVPPITNTAVSFEFATTATTTDFAMVTVGTTERILVHNAQIVCDVDNTVKVSARMGLHTTTTPTTTGVVLTHPGINPGSGINRGDGWPNIIAVGALGEDLRVTFSTPTSGSVRALVTYSTSN